MFLCLLGLAFLISSIGFKKYIWFISLGYGFSIAAIGAALIITFHDELTCGTMIACTLLILYGFRLGGYLAYREMKSTSYNTKMKTEIKDGKYMPLLAKCGIWISSALLYTCQTSPLLFRLENNANSDSFLWIGLFISICGLILESAADLQKSSGKRANPRRFIDTGLFRIVRCPNYFGEMLFWTGVFIGSVNTLHGVWQWVASVFGYIEILFVMFSGARRLELRQERTYGDDPTYQIYVKKTPILLPLIPLYSLKKHKWLVS